MPHKDDTLCGISDIMSSARQVFFKKLLKGVAEAFTLVKTRILVIIVIKQLLDKLYFEYQTEVVFVSSFNKLMFGADTSHLYLIQIANTLTFSIWHKIIEFV